MPSHEEPSAGEREGLAPRMQNSRALSPRNVYNGAERVCCAAYS